MLRVGLLVPPGFANLSFAPLSVFEATNTMLGEPFYEPHVVSVRGGPVPNTFGMAMQTEPVDDVALDTLLVGSRSKSTRLNSSHCVTSRMPSSA